MPISSPQPAPVSPTTTPFYGTLEIPSQDDDGPPDGVTLDRAIDITLERSLDLRSKFLEIPMARPTLLQANLRSNPIFYQDGQLLQYRGTSTQFTRAAPGGPSQFDTNITYPLDVSHKRTGAHRGCRSRRARAGGLVSGCRPPADRRRVWRLRDGPGARQTVRYAKRSADRYVEVAERNEERFIRDGWSERIKSEQPWRSSPIRSAEVGSIRTRLKPLPGGVGKVIQILRSVGVVQEWLPIWSIPMRSPGRYVPRRGAESGASPGQSPGVWRPPPKPRPSEAVVPDRDVRGVRMAFPPMGRRFAQAQENLEPAS